MTETELIELLNTNDLEIILDSDKEYLVADLSIFNVGHVLTIELVNDFPASIFDEDEQMIDGYYIYDRGSIEDIIRNK
jgi:hypothetical protein